MNKTKLLLSTFIISALVLTGCNQPGKTPDGINIPEKDANAEAKVESHNKVAKSVHEIGVKVRKLNEDFGIYQNPNETEKPTSEDIKAQYDALFAQSEELRKSAEGIKEQTEIYKAFETDYLPKLDEILNSFQELTPQPEDQDKYKIVKEKFNTYYQSHNKFVEVLNENIYY